MQCPHCQETNLPQAKYCQQCGVRLVSRCSNCGTELPANAKFCFECGQPVSGEASGTGTFASPKVYTPPHLAEKILTARSAVVGERKQVTVFFADIRGSMELLAERDPEEAREILDPALRAMMEAVHRYEGTVNQVLGDGIMALFGAPLAHEDHAVRACYAALHLQKTIAVYADDLRRREGLNLQLRVGLNAGEVVVGGIGNDLAMDYTAVGQTTHLAARMEQLSTPGSILISDSVARLAEGYVQLNPVGPVTIKGLHEPVEVFELIGAGPVRRRLEASASRGLTRFVGRQSEFGVLRQAMRQAADGRGQVVALVGEAGVGKSRLFYEFIHSHGSHDWLVLETTAVSYGKSIPGYPVTELLKGYFQIDSQDDQRRIREKVTGKLLTLDESFGSMTPAILWALDAPVDDEAWQALDPSKRRNQTLEAITKILLRESRIQPLMVVFEDLHWIDIESQHLLDRLIDSLDDAALLLLLNYRPEYEHNVCREHHCRQLHLATLPPESSEALLQHLMGDDATVQPLKRLLIERSGGNPFFLEESVRALAETGELAGKHGAYYLTKPLGAIQAPATVQAILAARIDRLPSEEKRLLQSAAVIGKSVAYALLQSITDLPDEALQRALDHLQNAEFFYQTNLFPDLEYTFKHALTHNVAYESLLHEQRRLLHARIMAAMERLYANRLDEHLGRLAYHATHGEDWQKAFTYQRQAGTKAMIRSAHREAVGHFEHTLEAVRRLPETSATLEAAIDLRIDLRNALVPLGELSRIASYVNDAEVLAEKLGDQARLGRVYALQILNQWLNGERERAIATGERAIAIAEAEGIFSLKVESSFYLGIAHYARGDYAKAIELHRQLVAILSGDAKYERFGLPAMPAVAARSMLCYALCAIGEFAEGAVQGEEAVKIAQEAQHPYSLILAQTGMGFLYLQQGYLEKSIAAVESAMALGESEDIPVLYAGALSGLAYAYSLLGRVDEALPLIDQVLDQDMTMFGSFAIRQAAWQSEIYMLAERFEEALEFAECVIEDAHDLHERGNFGWGQRLMGEIFAASHSPDIERATGYFREALELAEEMGMRPLKARCLCGLGRLYRRAGRTSQAREHLTAAIDMFADMDMPFFLRQAREELARIEA